jgi:26S proteasome regulatory subunit N10
MAAQTEAVNYICSMKTQANEENAVGVLTMAGKRIDVLMTPTRDLGAIMSSVQGIKIGGKCNFLSGLKTAQLCLKNRSNKNQRQRIIMFVASPVCNRIRFCRWFLTRSDRRAFERIRPSGETAQEEQCQCGCDQFRL